MEKLILRVVRCRLDVLSKREKVLFLALAIHAIQQVGVIRQNLSKA